MDNIAVVVESQRYRDFLVDYIREYYPDTTLDFTGRLSLHRDLAASMVYWFEEALLTSEEIPDAQGGEMEIVRLVRALDEDIKGKYPGYYVCVIVPVDLKDRVMYILTPNER